MFFNRDAPPPPLQDAAISPPSFLVYRITCTPGTGRYCFIGTTFAVEVVKPGLAELKEALTSAETLTNPKFCDCEYICHTPATHPFACALIPGFCRECAGHSLFPVRQLAPQPQPRPCRRVWRRHAVRGQLSRPMAHHPCALQLFFRQF